MSSKVETNLALFSTLFFLLLGFATSDINQDRAECTDKLIGLASCLPYAQGVSKTPTIDCCSGLKQVVDKSKRCLCILIKDRDDPSIGIQINVSRALALPSTCNTPMNVTQCVDLLHLPSNSSEAKVFEGFQKALGNSSAPISGGGKSTGVAGNGTSTALDKSSGGWGKRWLVAEVLCGILPLASISYFFLLI